MDSAPAPPRRFPALLAAGAFAGALTVVVMRLGHLELRVQELERGGRPRPPLRPSRGPPRGSPRPPSPDSSDDESSDEDAAPEVVPAAPEVVPAAPEAVPAAPENRVGDESAVVLEDNASE